MGMLVLKKQLPPRPAEFIPDHSEHGDILWAALTQCWSPEPASRPTAAEVRDMVGCSIFFYRLLYTNLPYVVLSDKGRDAIGVVEA